MKRDDRPRTPPPSKQRRLRLRPGMAQRIKQDVQVNQGQMIECDESSQEVRWMRMCGGAGKSYSIYWPILVRHLYDGFTALR